MAQNEPIFSKIERLCIEKGLKMTGQRKIIAQIIARSNNHPDVDEIYREASAIDPKIGIATIYRTLRMFEEAGIVDRHDFRDGRARYEEASEQHHDHLIDIKNGDIIEFHNEEIEKLQEEVARKLGYQLVDHRLELFAIPLKQPRKT